MLVPPTPDNEAARLAALYALLMLDSPPEERFDRIVEFAAREFDVPISLITLLDDDRQWFKAAIGMGGTCQSSRDISFCGHTILKNEIMVIPDAHADPRFADNPLVTGAPHIRFYAGAPLVLPSGYAVGSLCVIDTAPRTLAGVQLAILSTLRHLAVKELTTRVQTASA
ncbi:GAF domain-containing protein [Pseudoduganella flava]|uniref:GAF domain-containing protein n=1 Tax=Pseudoduganella flava TaxID=871742 RepID=A0A562Q0D0_9BURK|nr:GAF domain-containing protein [Pseudoduganella flava]QGZ38541.1 GAF domain-containing protein [Pseudoduganella flava]TWI49900.1 GAF domain-containing protein [Pseudoduganella flava]